MVEQKILYYIAYCIVDMFNEFMRFSDFWDFDIWFDLNMRKFDNLLCVFQSLKLKETILVTILSRLLWWLMKNVLNIFNKLNIKVFKEAGALVK